MGTKRKVGILGGTFDPIHNAHLKLGQEALRMFGLERIVFMPTGNSYFKTRKGHAVTAAEDRAAMVRLAIAPEKNFVFSDREISRPGETYTADTLAELVKEQPDTEFYFIVGADSIHHMDTWYAPEIIFQNATILAANRNAQVSDVELERDIKRLENAYGARILPLNFESLDISSSEIRRLLESGMPEKIPVPAVVLSYIQKHHLYLEEGVETGE